MAHLCLPHCLPREGVCRTRLYNATTFREHPGHNVLVTFLQVSSRAVTLYFFIISENGKNEHEIYPTNSIHANCSSLGACNSYMLLFPCLFFKNSYLHAICSVEIVPECLVYSYALSIVSLPWTQHVHHLFLFKTLSISSPGLASKPERKAFNFLRLTERY